MPDDIQSWQEQGQRGYASEHCNKQCPWADDKLVTWMWDPERRWYSPNRQTIRVECKPDLGDDFPSVLRQVTRYDAEHFDHRCVVVRRHSFGFVTWEQVSEMFRASGITLVPESSLAETGDT